MEIQEEIFNECLARMEQLKLSRQCYNAFKHNKVWRSETRFGSLYETNEKEQAIIDEFEKEYVGYKVYHLIHNNTEFGELYSLLYVSTEKEEWENDRDDINNGVVFAYVKNVDDDWCSEFGSIGIACLNGGLVRTA